MSEIRFVRCPRCNKVLPEPANVTVYQCGACGALLRSGKSILGDRSEKLVSSDKGGEGEAGVDVLMERSFDDQEGISDTGTRSPVRSKFGDAIGIKSPIKESHLNELNGDSPKSSMENEFFGDNASVLDSFIISGSTSGSRMRERDSSDFDFDGGGKSMRSLRDASKSPLRGEVGGQTPVSVRSSHFSRSPMSDFNGVSKSPAQSTNVDSPNSQIWGNLVSKFDDNVGGEKEVGTGQSNLKYHGGQRTCRDRHGNGVDQISDYGMIQEGSTNGYIRGSDRGSIDQWVNGRHGVGELSGYHPGSMYGYDDQRHNFDTMRGPASVQDLELERVELLRKYNDLKDQLSGLDNKRNSSSRSRRGANDYREDESSGYNYHLPQYGDPFSSKLARRPRHKHHHHSLDFDPGSLRPYNGLVPGHIHRHTLDFDRDSLDSYLEETRYHHPACSCSFCLEDGISVNSAHNPRVERYVPRPGYRHSRQTLETNMKKRLCYPIAGGSPFVLCCKCFRLLKLPRKLVQKNYDQLQCGACATIISFDLQTMSFGLFLSQQKLNSDGSDSGIGKVSMWPASKHLRGMTATSTNFGSYDFDTESTVISKGQRLSSSSADNLPHLSPSSQFSRFSKEDCYSDTSEKPPFINLVRPPPGSTLEDHMEYSNIFRKLQTEGTKSTKGSLENAVISTKVTQDPGEVEEDKATNSKDKHSSIAGLVKWGFASKSGRSSVGKAEVYVNGRPISHRMVKRAEKFSGPIEHGEYWYDSKAGFWGVMGHRCLGIIPSSIQELNFPMPMNCSNGDTTIYVNGRELHKRDMDLLSNRGLPKTSNKSYIVDISGKVVEEETREFVVNLGKLAPSIERKRCGYGMQIPEKLED